MDASGGSGQSLAASPSSAAAVALEPEVPLLRTPGMRGVAAVYLVSAIGTAMSAVAISCSWAF